MAKSNKERDDRPFAQRHPKLNFLLGFILLVILLVIAVCIIYALFILIKTGIEKASLFLNEFVNTTDQVIVVAMITAAVSIISVLFSSVISKYIDYRYNVKKYLFDKREQPYEAFISMVYKVMEGTRNEYSDEVDAAKMITDISQGLTLWGSKRVVRKWLKYRKSCLNNPSSENLFILEEIIYEIRRDVGQKGKLKKGDMLAFFINDIDNLLNKNK